MKTSKIFRRLFSLLFNALFNNRLSFYFLGLLNKRFKILKTIYVGYSVDDGYAQEYSFPSESFREKYKWSPFLAGFVFQNKKIGLKFFIAANEDDFLDKSNKKNLLDFISKIDRIKELTHAGQKTFAGVLPGVLYMARIIRSMNETEVVVESVCKAIEKVKEEEGYPTDSPVIILGGKGFIGKRVVRKLGSEQVYCVDKSGDDNFSDSWPSFLKNQKSILVNISRQFVLKNYIPHVWPSLVLLNEVYPEPSQQEILSYREKGGNVYHLAGVKGVAIPSFPKAYSGSIPCSAAYMNDQIDVVIKRLD